MRGIYDCRSVPMVYQINKCLMTLSLPLFNLIRGGTALLDGWLYSSRLWIWNRGLPALHSLCVLLCAAAWLLPKPLNYSWPPAGSAVRLQPFEYPAATHLRGGRQNDCGTNPAGRTTVSLKCHVYARVCLTDVLLSITDLPITVCHPSITSQINDTTWALAFL